MLGSYDVFKRSVTPIHLSGVVFRHSGEGICFSVLFSRAELDREVIFGKVSGPLCLSSVQEFLSHELLEVVVMVENYDMNFIEVVVLFFESFDDN